MDGVGTLAESSELIKRLEPVIQQVRDRHSSVERVWLQNHAAWRGIRTRFFYNSESFKHYVPAARRAIERTATRMRAMLAPQNDFFEVYPGDIFDLANTGASDAVSSYLAYLFEQRIRTKSLVAQLCRSILLYGRAITKTSVLVEHWSEDAEGEVAHVDIWPTMRAVDPFSFFVFPETITDLEDAQLIFEDSMYPWSDYLDAVEQSGGLIDPLDRNDLEKPTWPTHHVERLQLGLVSAPTDLNAGVDGDRSKGRDNEVGKFVHVSEVFLKYQQTWLQIWIAWNLKDGPRIVRNHQIVGPRQPYRMALAREIPGETDTTAMMDDIEPLQILLNDQVNRMEEAASISAVPPTAVDPNRVTRADSLVFRPRAKWLVEPDGVKMLEVRDTSRGSQAAVMSTLNLITSVFSPGGIVEGTPPRGSPRAGFAFSSMVNLSMADIKDLADTIEESLLTPSLRDLYALTVRFVPRDQVLRIPGTADYQPQNLTTYDLYGHWNFKWVGQLHSEDLQVRGQKLQQFLEGAAALLEPLMMQGYQLDIGQLLKMYWRDVLQERGIDRILVKLPPQGATPPGPPMAPPGVNPAQAMAGMMGPGGGQSAPTPENRERQQSRQRSGAMGAPSQ